MYSNKASEKNDIFENPRATLRTSAKIIIIIIIPSARVNDESNYDYEQ